MKNFFVLFLLGYLVCGCGERRQDVKETDAYPDIFPDYQAVTIPVNVAPLNFKVSGADRIEVEFSGQNTSTLVCRGNDGIDIPLKKWRKMLEDTKNGTLSVKVFARKDGIWNGYRPFEINVVSDSIDAYVAYRLIEPGYELGTRLSLYQRELSSFDEDVFVHYSLTDNNCVNCHAFCDYSPDRFMFHVRQKNAGTVIVNEGEVKKIDTKTKETISAGAYRMWHPSGKYIAFSNNETHQAFYAFQTQKIEVYDLKSDLMIYDVDHNKVLTDKRFKTEEEWETYPAWSPDGKYLYFCRAVGTKMPMDYRNLKYGIYRVAFDDRTGVLADSIETVIDTAANRRSASYPSVSPDGKYLLYTTANAATFPIHHVEADLEMINLETGAPVDIREINSPLADSYHAWSSSGRWIVFGSRRQDGSYTHIYFAYFDKNGRVAKPFVLPQKDAGFYHQCLKSFNIPEFIKGRITVSPYRLEKAIKEPAQNAL